MVHSFDRQPSPVKTYEQTSDHAYSVDDQPQLNVGGVGGTQRHLRNYQVTMIGFCSGIGTGLFVGSGAAYAKAGPAGLLLAYSIVGVILWCVMQSISELATLVRSKDVSLKLATLVLNDSHSSPPPALSHIGLHVSSTHL